MASMISKVDFMIRIGCCNSARFSFCKRYL